jgi:propionyl-CoA synthetase
MGSRYHEVYADWQNDPEAFWTRVADAIDWIKPWDTVFDPQAGVYGRWFVGATCNTCWNCVDRHVAVNRADQIALIYDSPITGTQQKFTYAEMKREVVALASALKNQGVRKGDRVIIYMPMVPEAVFAMLACARLGAIHSVVFGGFAARELATRIDDAKPKLIVSASCGLEPGASSPTSRCSTTPSSLPRTSRALPGPAAAATDLRFDRRPRPRLADQVAPRAPAGANVDCVPVEATDPLYVLYTSGTTGQPKGVVRDNGGHMVALKWSMENEFGVKPGETFWAASDVGWVVGHSYIVYAPLLHGCTTVLFEGKPVGTPDAGTFWRVIAKHGVVALFTAPTAFRAIKEDPDGEFLPHYDLSKFRTLFLAGERADPDTIKWAEKHLGKPVIDHWWQTETGCADQPESDGAGHAAGEIRLALRADARLGHPGARRCRPRGAAGMLGNVVASCRCRPGACRRCGTPTSVSAKPISTSSPAITKPPTPAISTRTATCSSWPAPTTSSTSPVIACRPAAWRRCWPSIPTSPNAR